MLRLSKCSFLQDKIVFSCIQDEKNRTIQNINDYVFGYCNFFFVMLFVMINVTAVNS